MENHLVDLVAKAAKISKKAAKTAILTVENSATGKVTEEVGGLYHSVMAFPTPSIALFPTRPIKGEEFHLMPSGYEGLERRKEEESSVVDNLHLMPIPTNDMLKVNEVIDIVIDCCLEIKQKLAATNEKMDKIVEERRTFWQEIESINGEISKHVQRHRLD